MATVYLAQFAGLQSGGTLCNGQTAITPASATWTAGNIYVVCGNWTLGAGASGTITVGASGTSGSPIIIRFDNGVLVQAPYWGNNGFITASGKSFITIDGSYNSTPCGYINGVEVACTATIEATANGAALANQVPGGKCVSFPNGGSNLIVQNLTCANLFVGVPCQTSLTQCALNETTGNFGLNSACVFYLGSGFQNITIQNNVCHDVWVGFQVGYEGASSGVTVQNNWTYNYDGFYQLGAGSSGAHLTAPIIVANNEMSNMANFDTSLSCGSSCPNHHEFMHIYTQQNPSSIGTSAAPMLIYGNYLHGTIGYSTTAEIYIECDSFAMCGAPNNLWVVGFNNIIVNTDPNADISTGAGGNGMTSCEGANCLWYNNTFYSNQPSGGQNTAIQLEAGSIVTAKNNIFDGMNNAIAGGSITASNNLGFGLGTACGGNCSVSGDPKLNLTSAPPYQLQSGSAAIGAGTNLTALGIAPLDIDFLGTARPGGATAWDIGAYQFASVVPAPTVTFAPAAGVGLGNVIVNSPAMVVEHLQNTGTATLNITSITVGGTNAAMFTRYTTCGATLAAGQTCEIAIKFIPTSTGAKSATISVVDNAAGSPHVFNVTGTGIAGTVPTTDQYGGKTAAPCASTTGRFHVEQLSNKWTYCTPLGNSFYLLGSYIVDYALNAGYTTKIIAKYGSATAWAVPTLNRIASWGFNSPYYDSNTIVKPFATDPSYPLDANGIHSIPVKMPVTFRLSPGFYGMKNAVFAPTPAFPTGQMLPIGSSIKNMAAGWTPVYIAPGGFVPPTGEADYFDPNLLVFANNFLASQTTSQRSSPYSDYIIGYAYDDGDQTFGLGAGPDFPTTPPGHNNPHLAWLVATMAPTQVASNLYPVVYTNTEVFTKATWANYLQTTYGTVAALNTAWGSNYTTFGSSGTVVTGEAVGTGNGSTVTFSHTLAHLTPAPFSIQVLVNGVPFGGDLGKGTTGTIYGATAAVAPVASLHGTIVYSTGALSLTFVTAPANGATITVNYIQNGWQTGTGVLDEDGRSSHQAWLSGNAFTLNGANANTVVDLNNFLFQLANQYLGIGRQALTAAFPGYLFLGPDSLGTWQCPPYRQVLQAVPGNLDVYTGPMVTTVGDPNYQAKLDFIHTYAGNIPQQNGAYLHANPDSPFASNPLSNDYPTQAARGQAYANLLVGTKTSAYTANGVNPFVSLNHFDYLDIAAENTNWGLVTLLDNAYDGHEDTTANVPCTGGLSAYTCGGEAATYGNYIGCVTQANLFGTVCSGSGTATIALNPTSFSYPSTFVGNSSSPTTFVLTNSGTAAASISGITFIGTNPGDFSQTNNCGASLAAGNSCNILVTFTPTAGGARSASLQITAAANGNPQIATLSGTGITSAAGFFVTPVSIVFGNQIVATQSGGQVFYVTNIGSASLTFSSVALNDSVNWGVSTTCVGSIAPNAGCMATVVFQPQSIGTFNTQLLFTDNTTGSPQSVAVSGTAIPVPTPQPTPSGTVGIF